MTAQCPGSGMTLDAPEDAVRLTCPHCSQRVAITRVDWWERTGVVADPNVSWRLRGHQEPTR